MKEGRLSHCATVNVILCLNKYYYLYGPTMAARMNNSFVLLCTEEIDYHISTEQQPK